MKVINCENVTNREKEIILLILSGKNKREIADLLCLSIATIKTNIEKLYNKFGVHNKSDFLVYMFKRNMIEFDEYDYEEIKK